MSYCWWFYGLAFDSEYRYIAEKIFPVCSTETQMEALFKHESDKKKHAGTFREHGVWCMGDWVKSVYLKPVSVRRFVTAKLFECSSWLTSGAARSLLNRITRTKTTNKNTFSYFPNDIIKRLFFILLVAHKNTQILLGSESSTNIIHSGEKQHTFVLFFYTHTYAVISCT